MLTLLTLVALPLLGAPAHATKDPFKPLVTSQDVTDSTSGTTTTTEAPGQPAVIGVPEEPTTESMPTTGSDVAPWLVLAYALVVTGGGAVVLARTLRPAPWQPKLRIR